LAVVGLLATNELASIVVEDLHAGSGRVRRKRQTEARRDI
jgi:hypothetical protein